LSKRKFERMIYLGENGSPFFLKSTKKDQNPQIPTGKRETVWGEKIRRSACLSFGRKKGKREVPA